MTCPSRSPTPLCVIRGLPATFPMSETAPPPPDGSGLPIDLTGTTITATVTDDGSSAVLPVARNDDAHGRFSVSLTSSVTAALPESGGDPRIIVTLIDTQGSARVYVYPLRSEVP